MAEILHGKPINGACRAYHLLVFPFIGQDKRTTPPRSFTRLTCLSASLEDTSAAYVLH